MPEGKASPSSSSSEGKASASSSSTKGKPSPSSSSTEGQALPAAYLDDDGDKVYMHVGWSLIVFFMFFAMAANLWLELRHWHDVVILAIFFFYLGVIINLLITKRHEGKRRELEACKGIISTSTWPDVLTHARPSMSCFLQSTSTLILVVTGIMVISLGVAVFIFRPDWIDLTLIAICIFGSMLVMFFWHKIGESEEKKRLRAKSGDDTDLV